MPLDEENLTQYATPFRCPECGQQTFQTDAKPSDALAFVEAQCTNCGHALTKEEIEKQASSIPASTFQAMMTKYQSR